MHLISDVDDDLIVESWRRAQARCSLVGQENSNKTLFGRARGWCEHAVAAKSFCFGVSGRVLRTVHRRRRRHAKVTARLQVKRRGFVPVRPEHGETEDNGYMLAK